jgi:hypothetical protein
MRKEITSTFSEGLNYDLNPLTTPNNVLTDCVNGTFITFNGDELALQSSIGNEELTQLSDGFYPLAMKEHGGVVYIISGRKPTGSNIATVYTAGANYSKGVLVFIEVGGVKHYYESLVYDNSEAPSNFLTTRD